MDFSKNQTLSQTMHVAYANLKIWLTARIKLKLYQIHFTLQSSHYTITSNSETNYKVIIGEMGVELCKNDDSFPLNSVTKTPITVFLQQDSCNLLIFTRRPW